MTVFFLGFGAESDLRLFTEGENSRMVRRSECSQRKRAAFSLANERRSEVKRSDTLPNFSGMILV